MTDTQQLKACRSDKERLISYAVYIAKQAISRLKSIDRDLRELDFRIDEGSTREKIKNSIKEMNHYIDSIQRFESKDSTPTFTQEDVEKARASVREAMFKEHDCVMGREFCDDLVRAALSAIGTVEE